MSIVSRIVRQSGSDIHKFSDDTQLSSSALPADFGTLIKQTESCVEHVKAWMESNKLKLNGDITEYLALEQMSITMSISRLVLSDSFSAQG